MTETTMERAQVPPDVDVLREAPFALRAADDEPGDGLTLDGFAAVFNRETIVDSWEGRFKEKISPGAMKKSFRENPPKIQFDHGRHPLIGSIPIASVTSVAEDIDPELAPDGGAHVVGRLHDNWLIDPVRDAIASRTVDGMSFRFSVVGQKWFMPDGKEIKNDEDLFAELRRTWFEDVPDDELLLRDLKELKVPELGPVVWPAYDATSVGVRSTVIDLGSLDDPDTRKTLARAVLLADAAEQCPPQSPRPTGDRTAPAGEHDDPVEGGTEDEPQVTETSKSPAGKHSVTSRDVYVGQYDADWYLPAI